MPYLLRDLREKKERRIWIRSGRPPLVAHLWTGSDTVCRMYSTGGITRPSAFRVAETTEGRRICRLCSGEPTLNQQFKDALERSE